MLVPLVLAVASAGLVAHVEVAHGDTEKLVPDAGARWVKALGQACRTSNAVAATTEQAAALRACGDAAECLGSVAPTVAVLRLRGKGPITINLRVTRYRRDAELASEEVPVDGVRDAFARLAARACTAATAALDGGALDLGLDDGVAAAKPTKPLAAPMLDLGLDEGSTPARPVAPRALDLGLDEPKPAPTAVATNPTQPPVQAVQPVPVAPPKQEALAAKPPLPPAVLAEEPSRAPVAISAGVAVVAAAAAAALGYTALGLASDRDAATEPARFFELQSAAEGRVTATNVAWAISGLGAITAGALFALSAP